MQNNFVCLKMCVLYKMKILGTITLVDWGKMHQMSNPNMQLLWVTYYSKNVILTSNVSGPKVIKITSFTYIFLTLIGNLATFAVGRIPCVQLTYLTF